MRKVNTIAAAERSESEHVDDHDDNVPANVMSQGNRLGKGVRRGVIVIMLMLTNQCRQGRRQFKFKYQRRVRKLSLPTVPLLPRFPPPSTYMSS